MLTYIKTKRFYYGYYIVGLSLFILVLSWTTYSTFGIFFTHLIDEFGWNSAATSGAFSLTMLVQGLIGVATGRLTDRIGPRLALSLCGFFLGLGYILTSFTGSLWQFYLFYGFMTGIGMSTMVPLVSTVARWFQ